MYRLYHYQHLDSGLGVNWGFAEFIIRDNDLTHIQAWFDEHKFGCRIVNHYEVIKVDKIIVLKDKNHTVEETLYV